MKKQPHIDMSRNPHLEGPKKHHNKHGTMASQPHGGDGPTVPNEPWERHYDVTQKVETNNHQNAFLPKRASIRPQPYVKVNECDH